MQAERDTPWDADAPALEPVEGPYSYFEAWRRWVVRQLPDHDVTGQLDVVTQLYLFFLMEDLALGKQPAPIPPAPSATVEQLAVAVLRGDWAAAPVLADAVLEARAEAAR